MIRFTTLVLALVVLWMTGAGAQQYPHGHLDPGLQSFIWTNGGGAPLRLTPEQALMQERVAVSVPAHVREQLLKLLSEARRGAPNFVVYDSHQEDFMVSDQGRVDHRVIAMPSRWMEGTSKRAWVVYYTDPVTREQWRMTYYEVCGNIAITRVGRPVECRCEPKQGDVCWRTSSRVLWPRASARPAPLFYF